MAMISVRLTDEEENTFKQFATSKNLSLSELIRKTLIEKIEDEYDFRVYQEYLRNKEYKDARPISYLLEEIGYEI